MTIAEAIEGGKARLRELQSVTLVNDWSIGQAMEACGMTGDPYPEAGDILAMWALGVVAPHVNGHADEGFDPSDAVALSITSQVYSSALDKVPSVDCLETSKLLLVEDLEWIGVALSAALGSIGTIRSASMHGGMEAVLAMAELSTSNSKK